MMLGLRLNRGGQGDLVVSRGTLQTDAGLETACTISLFTDAPMGTGAKRQGGWWGDSYPAVPGDTVGSHLWRLKREKAGPDVLRQAEQYAREALKWLVDDGVAASVQARAWWFRPGGLALEIQIERSREGRWAHVWEVHLHAL